MTVSTEQVEAAARQLLDGRVQAVRVLAEARNKRHAAEAALAAAQREDAAAWAAAEKAGWTAAELQAAGLSKPTKRAPGRPRKTKQAPAPSQTSQQNTPTDEAQNG